MTTQPTPAHRKKLIEVDLPLDDINRETRKEATTRPGHPWSIHLWWARRRLAACRAVIFASMVDDPQACPDEFPTPEAVRAERSRLHDIIKRLVKWENTDERNPEARALLNNARYEIARSVARSRSETLPADCRDDPAATLRYLANSAKPIYDPFAGGGSIPLEAQRLGLKAIASDLNPVAVLINKALIELPHKFANKPPVNPKADPMGMLTGKSTGRGKNRKPEIIAWRGAAGLAADIRYYGDRMRQEAFEEIGKYYPKAKLPDGGEATVIAWLWARTVPCNNPLCGAEMPLMTTFQVSKETKTQSAHWLKPIIHRDTQPPTISFEVQTHREGVPPDDRTVVRGGKGATCIACGDGVTHAYIREQSKAKAGNMPAIMTCIVAEGNRKRLFVAPTDEHIQTAHSAKPAWRPPQKMPTTAYLVSGRGYGIENWHQLFTERQLTVLDAFIKSLPKVGKLIARHSNSTEYANIVCTYLALTVGRMADSSSSFARWQNSGNKIAGVFSRQAIPMVWDFAETNPFSSSTRNWLSQVELVAKAVENLPTDVNPGVVHQADATKSISADSGPVIVTDPPYYDNISYAELSDFFYVWLRPLLRDIYPDLFAGILVPISEEMIAAPRFEKKSGESAKERFERLMNETLRLIRQKCSPEFPSSIFYAYKQQEETRAGVTSTGWDTMLTAIVKAGFQIIGTWPMRTELGNRTNSLGANTLASSVILVCRPRPETAALANRNEFIAALEAELPAELAQLTSEGHIAPVDLAQAAIGPGMKIYSRYSSVQTIAGEPVTVREALENINRVIEQYHRREQGELDEESQFCLTWLEQHGYDAGAYGDAELLSQAKNVSIDALRDAHSLLTAESGSVQLLPPEEYHHKRKRPSAPMTAWEGLFRMTWHIDLANLEGEGIDGAAKVASQMGIDASSSVERLARLLYAHYDRRRDSQNAVRFNNLVAEWQDISNRAMRRRQETQGRLTAV